MSAEKIILVYTLVPMTLIFACYFYTERRRKQFIQPQGREKIFRCIQCGMVYTDDREVELSPCPKCGTSNEEIEF